MTTNIDLRDTDDEITTLKKLNAQQAKTIAELLEENRRLKDIVKADEEAQRFIDET